MLALCGVGGRSTPGEFSNPCLSVILHDLDPRSMVAVEPAGVLCGSLHLLSTFSQSLLLTPRLLAPSTLGNGVHLADIRRDSLDEMQHDML